MMNTNFKPLLSASILSADFACLGEQIHEAETAGIDWIHIDVMDGQFVPNITMGPFIVETCRRISTLPLDVHLMIDHPDQMIDAFAQAGASGLSVQIENTPHVYRTLQHIRACGCRPGIVLNPGTPAHQIESVLNLVDLVLVMTVNPGFSGQQFIPEVLPKISQVRAMLEAVHSNAVIEVDGGITTETLPLAFRAGAQVFVTATAIFKHSEGIMAGVRALRVATSL
jgi:ribulose-phosphate 3-epimerase